MKPQEFQLVREPTIKNPNGENYTLGRLYRNGLFFCHTCEDEDRHMESGGTKVMHKTAIPRGRYKVVTSMSHRFGKVLPEVLNVPGFEGVRIHGGNTAEDSSGCILVGKVRTSKGIAQCADTVQRIIDMIDDAAERGEETFLEVS